MENALVYHHLQWVSCSTWNQLLKSDFIWAKTHGDFAKSLKR